MLDVLLCDRIKVGRDDLHALCGRVACFEDWIIVNAEAADETFR